MTLQKQYADLCTANQSVWKQRSSTSLFSKQVREHHYKQNMPVTLKKTMRYNTNVRPVFERNLLRTIDIVSDCTPRSDVYNNNCMSSWKNKKLFCMRSANNIVTYKMSCMNHWRSVEECVLQQLSLISPTVLLLLLLHCYSSRCFGIISSARRNLTGFFHRCHAILIVYRCCTVADHAVIVMPINIGFESIGLLIWRTWKCLVAYTAQERDAMHNLS